MGKICDGSGYGDCLERALLHRHQWVNLLMARRQHHLYICVVLDLCSMSGMGAGKKTETQA
jgi:hypothetical protein